MSDIAIQVQNLGKLYRIGAAQERHDTLRDALMARRKRTGRSKADESLWALKEVSFSIEHGEAVGVIGRNGAGKSTLLKILSRITEPTTGHAKIHGRVGSLLEVGTGFHPELTGRENIYLNGAILGMKRAEIERRFDEIVAFSEIERFLDTPVKRYSSGMYVRLAFAVAAHMEPEILLVDEVLAVGDVVFQKKCLGKMGDVAQTGRTVLFVSHNMVALQSLCQRALWLNDGGLVEDGPSRDVVASYLELQATGLHKQVWHNPTEAPGNDTVRLHRVWVQSEDAADDTEMIARELPVSIGVEYWQLDPTVQVHITLHVYVEQQIVAFTTASSTDPGWEAVSKSRGLLRSVCQIPAHFFNTGRHRINLLVVENKSRATYTLENALSFEVVETAQRAGWYGKEPGVLRPRLPWNTECLGADA